MNQLKTLILAEHDGEELSASVYHAITAAQFWSLPVDVLVAGFNVNDIVQKVATISGVASVLYADAAHLAHPIAEDITNLILTISHEYQVILAAHSSYSKNILPRLAAKLDVAMISDALEIKENQTYVRSIYAGNVLSTVQSTDTIQVLTVHGSNFTAATNSNGVKINSVKITSIPTPEPFTKTRWISESIIKSDRPALTSAKVVISGGRSLGSAEKFEQILSPLALKLDAALGATRAAVDAGYAPNEIQVGQTGISVAPELYIAVGVSGAIQHTYGMKDSKIVVAINQDPDAPIFQVADYGLVADLFEAIPELTAALN